MRDEEQIIKIIKDLKSDVRDTSFYIENYTEIDREAVLDLLEFMEHMDLDEFWEEE